MSEGLVLQVFGRDDSQATRRCLRFFRERRMTVTYVDLARRPLAPAELRRFSQRYGAHALLDAQARAYRDAGLAYLRMSDDEVAARVLADPRLLRLPLVRCDSEVTVGIDEETWRTWQGR